MLDLGSTGIVSPDGSQIAFGRGLSTGGPFGGFEELWVMGPVGEEPRKIIATKEGKLILRWAWSPESRRIGYLRAGRFSQESRMGPAALESFDLKSGKGTTLLSDWQLVGDWWMSRSPSEKYPTQLRSSLNVSRKVSGKIQQRLESV